MALANYRLAIPPTLDRGDDQEPAQENGGTAW